MRSVHRLHRRQGKNGRHACAPKLEVEAGLLGQGRELGVVHQQQPERAAGLGRDDARARLLARRFMRAAGSPTPPTTMRAPMRKAHRFVEQHAHAERAECAIHALAPE